MKKLKKVLSIFLAMAMLICLSGSVVWATEETSGAGQQMTSDNMNFDVIFAIDGSGSMKKSDALKLRLTAGRLFTELASSNTARAGFVQFTNVIMDSAGLTDLSSEESKEAFRNRLSGLKDSVKGTWDTDISLGLTEALKLLKDGDSFGNDRNPVIILLSDGNTDLPNGPRTVEESNAELTSTLAEAAQLGVPVYSIGLNWDGKLDADYMQNIANQTGGAFYNITSASEFNKYMTDIFGNVADGESVGLEPTYTNGRYETNFVIDNSSVLTANIVVLTDKGVSDPQLTDPSGNNVPLDQDHGVIVTTDISDENKASTYTILKIMYPAQGAWKISVQGEADDAIQINLLTTYDISFVLSNSKEPIAGEKVAIKGKLVRDDKTIKDSDLLSGATATCTIVDSKGTLVGENLPMDFNDEKKTFTYKMIPEKSGNYYITAKLEGKDGSFSKEAAQYQMTVGHAQLTVHDQPSVSMWCSPIKTSASLNLKDYVNCESLTALKCEAEDNNIVLADYNKDTGVVTFNPLSTGKQTLTLNLSDDYGQSAALKVEVKVSPSWIWFVAALVILVILAAVVSIILKASKPKLKGAVTVELVLPSMLMNLTPSPVTLTMPAKKSDVMLAKLIQGDALAQNTMGNPIMQAGLAAFMEKIKLTASRGESVTVKILPKVQGMIMINNQSVDVSKGISYPLSKGDKLGIQFSADGQNTSTVFLKLGDGEETFGNDSGSIYGNDLNDGGFGTGFGTGFGSPFGNESNGTFGDAGESGGFTGGFSGGFSGGFAGGFNGGTSGSFNGTENTENFGKTSGNESTGGFSADTSGNSSGENSNFDFGSDDSGSSGSDDGFGGFF